MLSGPKDGELCLSGRPEKLWWRPAAILAMQIVRLTWVGRGGCFVEPSHGIESSKWAIFAGRWSWKSKSAKECVTTHLPNQLAPKMDGAEARDLYRPSGQEPGLDETLKAKRGKPAHPETAQPEVGSSGWKSTARVAWCRCIPAPLKIRRTECRSRPVVLITASGLQGEQPLVDGPNSNPSTVGGLLEPLTWRADRLVSAGDGLGAALSGAFPGRRTANSELCSECQSEEIQPSAGKRRDETTAKGTGLAESAGKEDPVELDSSPTFPCMVGGVTTHSFRPKTRFAVDPGGGHCQVGSLAGAAHLLKDNAVRIRTVKAWPIDPLDLRNLKLEVSEKVALLPRSTEIQPFVAKIRPSPFLIIRSSTNGLTDEMQPSCAQVSPKHPDGALTPERAFAHSCVHGHYCRKDLIEPASVKLETIMDHQSMKILKQSVHSDKNHDMCTDGLSTWTDSPRGRKSPTDSPRGTKSPTDSPRGRKSPTDSPREGPTRRGENHPRTVLVAKITHGQSSWRKSPTDSPRKGQRADMRIDGQTSWAKITRTVHGKGQRADMRLDGQSSWRKSPTDSPRGENHPRIVHGRANVLICVLMYCPRGRKSPGQSTEGPTC
ncbi:hypothetical protein Bca101_100895 [Brassica carinata]